MFRKMVIQHLRALLVILALASLSQPGVALAEGYWWPGFGSSYIDGPVVSIASFGQELVVGGVFRNAGGTPSMGAARWNGLGWASMAGPHFATCVANVGGELYGAFQNGHIMRWNGSAWVLFSAEMSGAVSIVRYQGDVVVANGYGVWRWTGSTWVGMASSITSTTANAVVALAVMGDTLVIGGDFTQVSGVSAKNIARWDGVSWSAFGAGTNGPVNALLAETGTLYIGGEFQFAGAAQASNVARWNGSGFEGLGPGLTSGFRTYVSTLCVHEGLLYAGGTFDHSGEAEIHNLARWNGTSWQSLGMDQEQVVRALGVVNGVLYAGGSQRAANGAGNLNVLRIDGDGFSPPGGGLDGPVEALQAFGDALIVSGNFLHAGASQVGPMVSWTDQWLPLPGGRATALGVVQGKLVMGTSGLVFLQEGANWTDLGHIAGSFEDEVYAFAEYQGQLIAGGTDLGRWDGTNWQSLGGGLNGTVRALTVYNGELIAGGDFTQAGGAPAPHIARWNGTSWSSVGWGINDDVRALMVHDGDLVAAGTFTEAGGNPALGIALWDGSEWHDLDGGITSQFGPIVNDLAVYGDDLIAGGFFTEAGGTPATCIALWDGLSWSSLQNGIESEVRVLEVFDGSLYVGGPFATASGVGSSYLARWIDSSVPVTLVSFTATRGATGTLLQWEVSNDHGLVGFHVYRSVDSGPREQISNTPIAGRTQFEFVDREAPRGAVEYWLLELDRGGSAAWHGPVVLGASSGSLRPVKVLASPNPFATTTTITVEASVPVTAAVFDLRGARVRSFPTSALDQNALLITWDGKNDANEKLASGIYFLRVETADALVWRRLVKIK